MIDGNLAEMPCRDLVEPVTNYLEDRLTPVDRARFEAHLADCEACRLYLEQFRQTIQAVGRLCLKRGFLPSPRRCSSRRFEAGRAADVRPM